MGFKIAQTSLKFERLGYKEEISLIKYFLTGKVFP